MQNPWEIIWNLNIDLPTTRTWRWWSCWCHLHMVMESWMRFAPGQTNAATPRLIHSDTRPKVVIDNSTSPRDLGWARFPLSPWAMHMAPTGSLASRGEVNAEWPIFQKWIWQDHQFHLFPAVHCKWIDNYLQLALPSLTLFWFFAAVQMGVRSEAWGMTEKPDCVLSVRTALQVQGRFSAFCNPSLWLVSHVFSGVWCV